MIRTRVVLSGQLKSEVGQVPSGSSFRFEPRPTAILAKPLNGELPLHSVLILVVLVPLGQQLVQLRNVVGLVRGDPDFGTDQLPEDIADYMAGNTLVDCVEYVYHDTLDPEAHYVEQDRIFLPVLSEVSQPGFMSPYSRPPTSYIREIRPRQTRFYIVCFAPGTHVFRFIPFRKS